MIQYFSGRRLKAVIQIPLEDKKAELTCTVYEKWEDIEMTTTAACGATARVSVSRRIGLTSRDSETLRGAIETSIGIEGIAQLKAKIEAEIQQQLEWSSEETESKEFEFSAPECGERTEIIYQLVREYEFAYRRARVFRDPMSWERTLRERSNSHHVAPHIEAFHPNCRCDPKGDLSHDGKLVFDFGNVSVRAPYTRLESGELRVQFLDYVFYLPDSWSESARAMITSEHIPEVVAFLIGGASEIITCTIAEFEGSAETPIFASNLAQEIRNTRNWEAPALGEESIKRFMYLTNDRS